MFKRILFISFLTFAIIFLVAGYFFLQRTFVSASDPLQAVPGDAAIVIQTGAAGEFFSAFSSETDIWTDLGRILNLPVLEEQLIFLDSLFNSDTKVSAAAGDKALCFSLHPDGRDNYEFIFYFLTGSQREVSQIREVMEELLPGHSIAGERIFERVRIYNAVFGAAGTRELSWAFSDGLFILSFSPVLIENALRQLSAGSGIPEDEAFQRVATTVGRNVDANIFVNLRLLPAYLSSFTGGGTQRLLGGFSQLGDWAELDLHLRDDAILLNGFSYSGRSEDNYLNVFRGQTPGKISIESVIPGYASAFVAIGLDNLQLFNENYKEWLQISGRSQWYEKAVTDFEKSAGPDPVTAFHLFMEGEVALVLSDWDEPGIAGESFLVISTLSRSMALGELQKMLDFNARSTGRNVSSYKHTYRVDRDISYDIYRFPFAETGDLLFGRIFGSAKTSYFSFVGNYLVFGESVEGLSRFIHANVLNQVLTADTRFREFSEYLASRNNFYFYSNVSRSAGLFPVLLNEELGESIALNIDSFRKFQALSLQFSSGREMIYNNILLKYSPLIVEEPHTEWQTLLDTLIDFKPALLLNHNTGENEIFVQDLNNTIYLINTAGRILWKKPLPGRIMGEVYQIDYYRNNRLQMLFNTREQIFLLDRNGNSVASYPITLPSPATAGLSLFDYENNKDYRIFIPSEDKSVVVRSKEGNVVPGWLFRGTEHAVRHQIRYIRADGRDYIVFADRQRVYILDRRGNVRVKPDRMFPVSAQNNIVYEPRTPGTDPRLSVTDTTGRVWNIYFDGKTEVTVFGEYSPGHYFDLQDISADGYMDHIFVDSNRVDVYTREGSLMFSWSPGVPVDNPPAYYYFSRSDRKLGLVSGAAGQIYLINSDGSVYKGFPLAGRSQFTIGFLSPDNGNFQLIVGSDNNFLYNYSVY